MSSEDSDEPATSHAFPHLLADLTRAQQPTQRPVHHLPTWSFPSAPVSRTSPAPGAVERTSSGTIVTPLSSSRSTVHHTPDPDLSTGPSGTHHSSLFSTPNRSIFSSGPPIASVSVNTAHASMSAPSAGNSANPLSVLTSPTSSANRRSALHQSEETSSTRNGRMTRVEKDVDDPSTPVERDPTSFARGNTTPTALTRLFAAPDITTPTVSRHASYLRTSCGTTYTRGMRNVLRLGSR